MFCTRPCRINHRFLRCGVLLVASCWLHAACGSFAMATLLTAGSSTPAVVEPDPLGGLIIIANSGPLPFTSSYGAFSGTLTSEVMQGDSTNPWGLTALTFTYVLTNDASSQDQLEELALNGFSLFQTDVSNRSTGVSPTGYFRSFNGNVVGFNFTIPGSLNPGETSALLVVQTDALNYTQSFASVLNSDIASVGTSAPFLIPIGGGHPSPEPSSFVLAILGLGGLAAWRWRRRNHSIKES